MAKLNISKNAKICALKNFKDTHREKAPSNEIPALVESINMDIWVVGISN